MVKPVADTCVSRREIAVNRLGCPREDVSDERPLEYGVTQVLGSDLSWVHAGLGGEPTLLVHGFASTKNTWLPVLRRLSGQAVDCFATDLPGSGDTPPDDRFSFDRSTELLSAFMHELGRGRRWTVVGHSMGGSIAMALSSMPRPAPTALVVESATPAPPHAAARLERIASFAARGARPEILGPVVSTWGVRLTKTDRRFLLREACRHSADTLIQQSRSILGGVPDFRVAADVRTRFIFGQHDQNRDVVAAQSSAERLGARFVLFDGSGHTPHIEEPDRFVRVIVSDWS